MGWNEKAVKAVQQSGSSACDEVGRPVAVASCLQLETGLMLDLSGEATVENVSP